jgi:cytochrome o ubiquinol oxidase subunit 3
MSDALIFASLFATYGVVAPPMPAARCRARLFELPLVALNTALLLPRRSPMASR